MTKQDDRAQKITEWLKHLQSWKDSGKSLAAYAKDYGLPCDVLLVGVLFREGHWEQEPKASAKSRSRSQLAPRFAKVAVTE